MSIETKELLNLVEKRYKSRSIIDLYSRYINSLTDRGLPPILSFKHLSDTLTIPAQLLYFMSFETHLFYKEFSIPKRSGGFRKISAPSLNLDEVHRWILEKILNVFTPNFSDCVIGYIQKKSIVDHIKPHIHSKQLIKFDLKNFFPSINSTDVTNIFLELGYTKSVSRIFSALTTVNNALPQGACTSPVISNIHMRKFDDHFLKFCKKNNLIYTRYADDMVISGDGPFESILPELKKKFINFGLTLNHSKTRIYKNESQVRFITGLILKNGLIRLPKEMRRRIRAQCHLFITKFDEITSTGLDLNIEKIPKSYRDKELISDPTFADRIIGKLNFWLQIEPNNIYAITMKNLIKTKLASLQ